MGGGSRASYLVDLFRYKYVGWLLEAAFVVVVVGCSRLYEAAAVMFVASILGGYWFGQQLTINQ